MCNSMHLSGRNKASMVQQADGASEFEMSVYTLLGNVSTGRPSVVTKHTFNEGELSLLL